MRIRTVFLVGFAAVAIPGLAASGWLAAKDWGQWGRALSAASATRVVSDVQRA